MPTTKPAGDGHELAERLRQCRADLIAEAQAVKDGTAPATACHDLRAIAATWAQVAGEIPREAFDAHLLNWSFAGREWDHIGGRLRTREQVDKRRKPAGATLFRAIVMPVAAVAFGPKTGDRLRAKDSPGFLTDHDPTWDFDRLHQQRGLDVAYAEAMRRLADMLDCGDDFYPPAYFEDKYDVTADVLKHARHREAVVYRKVGENRYEFSEASVKRKYREKFRKP
ncbi:MAG: hypothetical protein KKB50_02175 [Planctomycetes bacterium]|nr:hypothetical protein [Planctomycetota bacterium]